MTWNELKSNGKKSSHLCHQNMHIWWPVVQSDNLIVLAVVLQPCFVIATWDWKYFQAKVTWYWFVPPRLRYDLVRRADSVIQHLHSSCSKGSGIIRSLSLLHTLCIVHETLPNLFQTFNIFRTLCGLCALFFVKGLSMDPISESVTHSQEGIGTVFYRFSSLGFLGQ